MMSEKQFLHSDAELAAYGVVMAEAPDVELQDTEDFAAYAAGMAEAQAVYVRRSNAEAAVVANRNGRIDAILELT
jgi:hypothetical protein